MTYIVYLWVLSKQGELDEGDKEQMRGLNNALRAKVILGPLTYCLVRLELQIK
jgi:hypothetical protein